MWSTPKYMNITLKVGFVRVWIKEIWIIEYLLCNQSTYRILVQKSFSFKIILLTLQ